MGIGLLRVTGTIHVSLFWPDGQSDADTVIADIVPASAFVFRPASNRSRPSRSRSRFRQEYRHKLLLSRAQLETIS
jgi:hypothetical protein